MQIEKLITYGKGCEQMKCPHLESVICDGVSFYRCSPQETSFDGVQVLPNLCPHKDKKEMKVQYIIGLFQGKKERT
jgi:hypothetical protein